MLLSKYVYLYSFCCILFINHSSYNLISFVAFTYLHVHENRLLKSFLILKSLLEIDLSLLFFSLMCFKYPIIYQWLSPHLKVVRCSEKELSSSQPLCDEECLKIQRDKEEVCVVQV